MTKDGRVLATFEEENKSISRWKIMGYNPKLVNTLYAHADEKKLLAKTRTFAINEIHALNVKRVHDNDQSPEAHQRFLARRAYLLMPWKDGNEKHEIVVAAYKKTLGNTEAEVDKMMGDLARDQARGITPRGKTPKQKRTGY